MELIHGVGMYPATILDNQEDVVSGLCHEEFFSEHCKVVSSLEEVAAFHQKLVYEFLENELLNKAIETERYFELDGY